jgi:hypothetical protein
MIMYPTVIYFIHYFFHGGIGEASSDEKMIMNRELGGTLKEVIVVSYLYSHWRD